MHRVGGKVGILFLDFHFSIGFVVGAVAMWESRLVRFPRARGHGGKTCFWFSSVSTARHFHRPLLSGASPRLDRRQQPLLGLLHFLRRLVVAPRPGLAVQILNRHTFFEMSG